MTDDVKQVAQESGRRYESAIALGREDLQLRAVKYLLLRLSVGGLGHDDIAPLRALAGAAFEEDDIEAPLKQLRKGKPSNLALAIAAVVESARGSKRSAMLGAVLGAHAAHGARINQDARDGAAEMQGAVLGAAVFETHRIFEEMLKTTSWSDFVSRE
jgi:hypothetical protein